jgi:hypothetical protein
VHLTYLGGGVVGDLLCGGGVGGGGGGGSIGGLLVCGFDGSSLYAAACHRSADRGASSKRLQTWAARAAFCAAERARAAFCASALAAAAAALLMATTCRRTRIYSCDHLLEGTSFFFGADLVFCCLSSCGGIGGGLGDSSIGGGRLSSGLC